MLNLLEEWGLSPENAEKAIDYGIKGAIAIGILFLTFIVAGFVSRWTVRLLEKVRIEITLRKFAGKLVRWFVVILGFLACTKVFGVQLTGLATIFGASILAIGMALQGTLGNFAAGVMLLIFRPYKVNDLVVVEGQTGIIDEIGIFTTSMNSLENKRIIIPNGKAFGGIIENIGFNNYLRADISVGVDYTADIDKTRSILDKAAASVKRSVSDPYQIFLKGLGDSAVDWEVRVPAKPEEFWDVYQATIRAVKMELDSAGIGIPFPQRDVHLFNKN